MNKRQTVFEVLRRSSVPLTPLEIVHRSAKVADDGKALGVETVRAALRWLVDFRCVWRTNAGAYQTVPGERPPMDRRTRPAREAKA